MSQPVFKATTSEVSVFGRQGYTGGHGEKSAVLYAGRHQQGRAWDSVWYAGG